MAWDFHVGQRLVCIDDAWTGERTDFACPKKGGVYTIISFHVPGCDPSGRPVIGLCFHECSATSWFSGDNFRPLDERRLDPFRAHLAPAPRQLEAA